jgi:hypothetical protein
MLGCETPGQSAAVALASGGVAGGAGLTLGVEPLAVVALAATLAVAGEVAAHAVRGDDQWRDAVARVRTGAE